jgi:hypothetical protein
VRYEPNLIMSSGGHYAFGVVYGVPRDVTKSSLKTLNGVNYRSRSEVEHMLSSVLEWHRVGSQGV